jgi:tRNA threonylcarbamoyl adenosine modification protein YeaZ
VLGISRLLLAVDTSSAVVSAAVAGLRDDELQILASREVAAANRHAELLAELVHDLMRRVGVAPGALDAVVAGLGPGPFTGLRVGVVTVASLADALGLPSYGVCSLDAIARDRADGRDFLVCTDARRKQVYWARYDGTGARTDGPDIATPADVVARFAADVEVAVGAGTALYPDVFEAFDDARDASISAADVAHLVADRLRAGAPSDVLEPMYLRRPDATPPGRPKSVLPA